MRRDGKRGAHDVQEEWAGVLRGHLLLGCWTRKSLRRSWDRVGNQEGRGPGRARGWRVLRTTGTRVDSQVGWGEANWDKKQVGRKAGRPAEREAGPRRVAEESVGTDAGLWGQLGWR